MMEHDTASKKLKTTKNGLLWLELLIENILFNSRWILAPVYLGLVVALLILTLKFGQELWHIIPHMFTDSGSQVILSTLSLIDLVLITNLLLMIIFSGYENFVSTIDLDEGSEKLSWLGKMDASSLKQKVAASIVAISSIHLLKAFMNAESIDNDKLMWFVIIHMTFVISAIGMAYVDRLNHH